MAGIATIAHPMSRFAPRTGVGQVLNPLRTVSRRTGGFIDLPGAVIEGREEEKKFKAESQERRAKQEKQFRERRAVFGRQPSLLATS